jgi:hypothetical protein
VRTHAYSKSPNWGSMLERRAGLLRTTRS